MQRDVGPRRRGDQSQAVAVADGRAPWDETKRNPGVNFWGKLLLAGLVFEVDFIGSKQIENIEIMKNLLVTYYSRFYASFFLRFAGLISS